MSEEKSGGNREAQAVGARAYEVLRILTLAESSLSQVSHAPTPIFVKDACDGRFAACNHAFAQLVHRKNPDEVVGLTIFDLLDCETATHIAQGDAQVLSAGGPSARVETLPDAEGHLRQYQITTLGYTDADGSAFLLGMGVDLTELMQVWEKTARAQEDYQRVLGERVTYSRIARALSADYDFLYYVDVDTDYYVEFGSLRASKELSVAREGDDFFGTSRANAANLLYREDQEKFIEAFTKENILNSIARNGTFTLTYRLMLDGVPTFMGLKASLMEDDEHHLIIGVNNVDAEIKMRLAAERVHKDQVTYERMTALSGDYLCVYTVDPVSGHFVAYGSATDYDKLGFPKEGDDFFGVLQGECGKVVHPDDLGLLMSAFTKENVLREVERNGFVSMDYRVLVDGEPLYVSIKAAMLDEENGKRLIVGINNIDARVRLEQEYANNLSEARSRAQIDALTGVKNKHAYTEMEARLDQMIAAGDPVEFALAVCDINGLKQVNDTQGHQAGDAFIKDACFTICRVFSHSPVFRIGGDEFVVVMSGSDYGQADALVAALARANLERERDGGAVIACGLAHYQHDPNVASVFERADALMYENKRQLKG